MLRSIAAIAIVSLLTACPTRDPEPVGSPFFCSEELKLLPVEINRNIDILFVIDTSPSMADEQTNLATAYRHMMSVLESIEGGVPNVHIGVVSADLGAGSFTTAGCSPGGDAGRLHNQPRIDGCTPPADAYLRNVGNPDGTDDINYTGSLQDAFSCIANLGNDGCAYPQPLEAMRRALDGSNPENAGFLRDEAFLMVVFITDSDDCSVADGGLFDPDAPLGPLGFRCFEHGVRCDPDQPRTPGTKTECVPRDDSSYVAQVQPYVDFLKTVKQDPAMVIVSAVVGGEPVVVGTDMGDPYLEPACSSPSGSALPSPRLNHLLAQFPQRNSSVSMCSEDLVDSFEILTGLQATTLGVPCLEGELDLDPDQPGVQYECVVSQLSQWGTESQTEQLLPECETVPAQPGTMPCWHMREQPNLCPDTPTGLVIEIERGRGGVPSGTAVSVRCASSICEP